MSLPITIETRGLRLINCGWIRFERQDGATIKIGDVTIHIAVNPFDGKEASMEVVLDAIPLTMTYSFSGNIPYPPLTFLNLSPNKIGSVNGVDIFTLFSLSRIKEGSQVFQLDYSILGEINSLLNFSAPKVLSGSS